MTGPGGAAALPATGTAAAAAAVTAAAARSRGRLVAWLAWQWRDIAAAEDAVAEAFAGALLHWPTGGVPASPEAWLATTAQRHLLQAARRRRLADDPALTVLWPGDEAAAEPPPVLPDARLRLLFVCSHPAIDPAVRTALMLQTVLGIDAARIAQAYLVSAEAMTKRLVRAKAKIKLAGIRFEEPGLDELPERLDAVLEAIYGAYALHGNRAQAAAGSPEPPGGEMAGEALYLAQLVAARLPRQAEALGLVALLGVCEARRPARLDAAGAFVPLQRQDPRRWDGALLRAADAALAQAAALGAPGPLQLEAAIQAAHCQRAQTGVVPWADIGTLYARLLAMAPTTGARIGHAMVVAQRDDDPAAGLRLLDAIDPALVAAHQPYWAARAFLLGLADDPAAAAAATGRALALTHDPAWRQHWAERLAALRGAAPAAG